MIYHASVFNDRPNCGGVDGDNVIDGDTRSFEVAEGPNSCVKFLANEVDVWGS